MLVWGEMFSSEWKPLLLNLGTWPGPIVDDADAAEAGEPELFADKGSVEYRCVRGESSDLISTTMLASLVAFNSPSNVVLACCAPAMVRNRRLAERNPLSSDCSIGSSSTSAICSCVNMVMSLNDSSVVLRGRRRILTHTVGDAEPGNAPIPYLGVSCMFGL